MPFPCSGSSGVLGGLFFGYVFIPCAFSLFIWAAWACVNRMCRVPFPGNRLAFQKIPETAAWRLWEGFSQVIVDSRWPFFENHSRVASHSRCQSRLKVAEESPESRKTSGGIFIVAIVAGSKSLAYFASSASMILSASAPYTSSRYFRRRASGSLVSPSGFSGFKTTSCWSV